MLLNRIRRFFIHRFKRIIYEMVKIAEKEELADQIEHTLSLLKFRGTGIRINGRYTITYPENVSIGNNVHIGQNAFFHGFGGLTIEDNVHISRNVTIYTYNHNYTDDVLPYSDKMDEKPVHIGKNVWIGMNVTIIPGLTIGEGAIIGIGTVVSKDIPPLAIVGNPPARNLKFRDKEHYCKLENESRYGGVGGKPLGLADIQKFKKNLLCDPNHHN
ncbi:MAG: acyltransferase [Pseudomonadota bacterium]